MLAPLTLACVKSGDFASAVKSYTESIKRDPTDPRGYNNRANAYTKLVAFPEALKDAEQAIKVDPKFGGFEFFCMVCDMKCKLCRIVKGYLRKSHILFGMKEYTKAMQAVQEVSCAFCQLMTMGHVTPV